MKKLSFVDIEQVQLEDRKANEDFDKLSKESKESVLAAKKVVDQTIAEINNNDFNYESENRLRKQGFTPSQAEQIAEIIKTKPVGEIFSFRDILYVQTPFKTIVKAQVYLNVLQDSVIQVTNEVTEFTNLSSFDLIKLSIKRLFKRG